MASVPRVLPEALRWRAENTPQVHFLSEVDGRTATYAELDHQVALWTSVLKALGLAAGDPVATMLPNSVSEVEVWLGAAWLGAVEVPINPAYKGRLLGELLEDSGASVLVVHADYWRQLVERGDSIASVRTVVVVGGGGTDSLGITDTPEGVRLLPAAELLAAAEPERPAQAPLPSDLGVILYTSGTTGLSKGVMVPWNQLYHTVLEMFPAGSIDEQQVYYSPYPQFHLGGKMPITLMTMFGGSVVLRERFSTRAFWKDVHDHSCTTTCLLGSMAYFLWNEPESPSDPNSTLRNVLMIPLVPMVEAFKERFDVRVTTCFNMTEISCPITPDGWDLADARSCGRVRAGYEVRLADSLDRPVPVGTPGEMLVRADEPWSLMAGYWRDPVKTVATWRNQWLHTGDVFVVDEAGNYYFVDRVKDAIRRRGENISSFEIERALLSLPTVAECAVVAVESDVGEEEVKAVLVPVDDVELVPADVVAALRDELPPFMVPRYIEVVSFLPKTETQKIVKDRLRAEGINERTWDAEEERLRSARHGG
jgi:crotonobetaine/carnitine-CoA ligase